MPRFSAFTPFGMLAFSSRPSHGETIYRSYLAALGGQYSTEPGSAAEARVYATATGLARARYTIDRARNQLDPWRSVELLPVREAEYGIVPGLTDTVEDRQAAVAAKMRLARGCTRPELEHALRALLGADFIALRTIGVSDAEVFPTDPTQQHFADAFTLRKSVRIPTRIFPGVRTLAYETADSHGPRVQLEPGDVLTVDPGNSGLVEVVTVEDATADTFVATFLRVHEPGSYATTQPFPWWASTVRHVNVIVSDAAAVDPETRRKVNGLLEAVLRGVTTWGVIAESAETTGFIPADDSTELVPGVYPPDGASLINVTYPR